MKFNTQFEYHKIPEWYSDYFDYTFFKGLSKGFAQRLKCKQFALNTH